MQGSTGQKTDPNTEQRNAGRNPCPETLSNLRYQCSNCTSSLSDERLRISLFSMHMIILGIYSRIITKQRKEVGCEGVDWIHVAQDNE